MFLSRSTTQEVISPKEMINDDRTEKALFYCKEDALAACKPIRLVCLLNMVTQRR